MINIPNRIAEELSVKQQQVEAAIGLLDDGSTVPFISRYRKEVTGALDDTQLRLLEERLGYLRELEDRRQAVLSSIEEQGKLTPALKSAIDNADTKIRLEDLYLPFKQKRRTKGQIAIEAGIEPLANALFADPTIEPANAAKEYITTDEIFKNAFVDSKGVLDGAKYILMERFAEDATLIDQLRGFLNQNARLFSTLAKGKEQQAANFQDYFEHNDAVSKVPSHRALAMFRGRKENFLQLKIDIEHDPSLTHPCTLMIAKHFNIEDQNRAADSWLMEVVRWTWKVKLHLHLETELMSELRARSEEAAIQVFANNLNDLLLAAPAGQKTTLGLDPGLRTGVKIAVIDDTGQFVDSATIYPHAPQKKWSDAVSVIARLAEKHAVKLLAIGNGTASRETDKLCAEVMKLHPQLNLEKVMVSEAGASVYSASELAAKEFPDLDVTIRGAVSIARRLQDPLAELVKIEPKSIGVGQYQHDVSQVQLARNLDIVIEDCVNAVGVEVNTASAALLKRVAGLNQTIADNIVSFRNKNGSFDNREQLKSVSRLGDKTFEQAAGFLRIHKGDNPLDASAVHPETYSIVERIAAKTDIAIRQLIGNRKLKQLDVKDFVDENFGSITVADIISELEKPGRDPRPEFKTAQLLDGVEKISDLEPGMVLEGTVTNVTNFGAFVDIGVHQDGLVHISALADKFVKDPREVVKAGDIVRAKVMQIDVDRKRIGLSLRLNDELSVDDNTSPGNGRKTRSSNNRQSNNQRNNNTQHKTANNPSRPGINGAFAEAFAKAQKKAGKPQSD
ncbi:MAG: RNA-binding transcriptional accessory protein [Pseudomonadales bacterium]|nr:RNA-binding transcriptional accessory protein [Pseudomonadales bacterium]